MMQNFKENKSYVTAEYLKKRAHDDKVVNKESYCMLNVKAGDKVLELGCGPGTAASVFSEAAGIGGIVVGLDCDVKMIQQAKIESRQYPNVLQLVGDAHVLPFESCSFNCVYAKRLFQVLPPTSAAKLLCEMKRVLKPGGNIVLVDTDWTSVSVNYSDVALERRLTTFFREHMRPNGLAGRKLLEMVYQDGFVDVRADVMSIVIRNFAETPFSNWLINEALAAKVATPQEMERWRSELEYKSEQRSFLFHVGTVLLSAKKK